MAGSSTNLPQPTAAAATEAPATNTTTTAGSPGAAERAEADPSVPVTITTEALAVEEVCTPYQLQLLTTKASSKLTKKLQQADEIDDNDSALGSDNASSTASVNSSIMQYRLENGRTYHSYKDSIQYPLPNDDSEQDRLDLQHHLFMLTLDGKLYQAPLGRDRPVERCLDAGTGTGVWAIDFADEHPKTEVLGIDISPIQPGFVPPNLNFQVDDLEEEWNFNYKFDFIFGRMLTGSIGDFPKLFRQSFENLNPGGWIELHDIRLPPQSDDGTLREDSQTLKWASFMMEAAAGFGRYADSAKDYKRQLGEAGFVNVTEVIYKWPMNRWPADPHYKELGFWNNQNISGGLSGLSMALFTRGLGWTAEEVEVFLTTVRAEMNDRSIHTWWPIHIVYGQKPNTAT